MGAKCIDVDAIGRWLIDNDDAIQSEIRRTFGNDLFFKGALDRKELSKRAFTSPENIAALNSITHPRIREAWCEALANSDARLCVVEIPLLFENNLENHFDTIVCVACNPNTQLERLKARGVDLETAKSRINRQIALSEKVRRSDRVIWNDGSTQFLQKQVQRLFQALQNPNPWHET